MFEYTDGKNIDFSSLSQEEQQMILNALGEFHTTFDGKVFEKEEIE
jgi:hypothetical protein